MSCIQIDNTKKKNFNLKINYETDYGLFCVWRIYRYGHIMRVKKEVCFNYEWSGTDENGELRSKYLIRHGGSMGERGQQTDAHRKK